MRKLLIGIVVVGLAIVGIATLAGFPPSYLYNAPGVASGIGSKLLCSARYVSGFSRQQSFDDLVQYSPILVQLSVEYDEANRNVSTSLFGLSPKTASYLPGIGCAVDYAGFEQRASIRIQEIAAISDPWPRGDAVIDPVTAMQSTLESLVERDNTLGYNTRALLVVHDGQIIGEVYAQGADETTPLLGWSMAKSLTSIMLGNLEYHGRLDLNAPPGFPGWENDERSRIRIADMLTMTDGLEFSEQYNPGDDATAMLFTEPSASDYVLEKDALYTPGEVFNYSSGTANLLARLYKDINGGSQGGYDDYVANIRIPFAFQNTIFEMDASGSFVGSSYFYASARDWARIGQFMLNRGTINSYRLVADDWIARATTPNSSENEKAYGYQWWLNRGDANLRWESLPDDAFSAQGNREQYLMVIPSLNLVIVRLGWTAGSYPVNERFEEIILAL